MQEMKRLMLEIIRGRGVWPSTFPKHMLCIFLHIKYNERDIDFVDYLYFLF